MMSAPSPISASIERSGEKKCAEPSRCDLKATPSSVLPQLAQAEYLESAGIGEDRLVPGHEALHSAKLPHLLDSGTQIEVIGVVEQDLNPELFEHILRNGFDGSDGSNRHKHRRLNLAVRRDHSSGTRGAGSCFQLERERH